MLEKADVSKVLAGEAQAGRRRLLTMIAAGVVGAVVVVGGSWLWWSANARAPAENYSTEAAAKGDIHVTLVATGTLQPTQTVAVSSTVTGTVATVDVDYNQRVVRGQALAHLDLRDLEARLARSRAMVEVQKASSLSAEASLADANAALTRAEALAGGSAVSQRDIDLARTAVRRASANAAAAAAQVLAAEADVKSARNDYDRGTIISPIDGVVLDINLDPGQSIGAASLGAALFTVATDLGHLDLEVEVDEADIARVAPGDTASFTVESAPDKPFTGTIRQVRSAPTVADGVVSYKALVAVDNAGLVLKPGMTATADIAIDDAIGVLTVPNEALRFSPTATTPSGPFGSMIQRSTVQTPVNGEGTVWVLDDGQPRSVALTVGLTDGQRTEIVGGELEEGNLVIIGSKAP